MYRITKRGGWWLIALGVKYPVWKSLRLIMGTNRAAGAVSFIEHVEQKHGWRVEIAQKPESGRGFVPEKNRWPVERSRIGGPIWLAQFQETIISRGRQNRRKFGGYVTDWL